MSLSKMDIMRQKSHKEPCTPYPRKEYGVLTDIMPVLTPKRRARFEAKVDRSGGLWACHPWLGGTNGAGYGLFQGSVGYAGYSFLAHRIAWAIANDREPGTAIVRHACDNPTCCNPKHLLIGTARDNVIDMVSRGRANFTGAKDRVGVDANAAFYTPEQRAEADRLRFDERWSIDRIAEEIGCHRATIMRWLAPARQDGRNRLRLPR